ncbi:MAG: DEAD/DEAH box helicase [Nanoarchaeota archaeon]
MHEYKGFTLDQFQVDAIKAIEENKSVVVSAPTGSGKTLIADYIINRDIHKGIKVIYTAPIKALSNQKYKEFTKEYGADKVGLLTGDVVRNPQGMILIMTTEIYRNMAIARDPALNDVSYVVFDEIHFINDPERGYVWEESIIFSRPDVRFLCLSATIPNAGEFAAWIQAINRHEVKVIRHDIRPVPLHVAFYDKGLGITTLKAIKELADIPNYHRAMRTPKHSRPKIVPPSPGDLINDIQDKLPALYFTFSRGGTQKNALELANKKILPHEPRISPIIRDKLKDAPPEVSRLESTKQLRQTLPYGIAFHHAGLLPIIKELVEELFSQGLIKVLFATETFAVGINMPAKSVCFDSMRKFDGRAFRMISAKEFFQIAGRAGRRGIDTEGFVFIMVNMRDFDYARMKRVTEVDDEPIMSQFKLSVNTVVNLIKRHEQEEIDQILCKSFHSFQQWHADFNKRKNYRSHASFVNIRKTLKRLGYLTDKGITWKGEFASKIYADEIPITEAFGTDFCKRLNEYQMLLVLACLCYEARESTEFHRRFPTQWSHSLKKMLLKHDVLRREARFRDLEKLTALMHPCYNGASLFTIMQNTSLLEGDLIRFFRQITDRAGQVKKATDDEWLRDMMTKCENVIDNCLKDIDAI